MNLHLQGLHERTSFFKGVACRGWILGRIAFRRELIISNLYRVRWKWGGGGSSDLHWLLSLFEITVSGLSITRQKSCTTGTNFKHLILSVLKLVTLKVLHIRYQNLYDYAGIFLKKHFLTLKDLKVKNCPLFVPSINKRIRYTLF